MNKPSTQTGMYIEKIAGNLLLLFDNYYLKVRELFMLHLGAFAGSIHNNSNMNKPKASVIILVQQEQYLTKLIKNI